MNKIKIVSLITGVVAICFIVYLFFSGLMVLNHQADADNLTTEINISGSGGSFSPGNSSNFFSKLAASISQQIKPNGDAGGGGGGGLR